MSREHVKAWLIRVTVNCAKKHFDLYWNKNVDFIENEETLRGEEAYEPPGEHPVRGAVSKLPPKYRLAVHLFYYEELSVAEIAKQLGRYCQITVTPCKRDAERLTSGGVRIGYGRDERVPQTGKGKHRLWRINIQISIKKRQPGYMRR